MDITVKTDKDRSVITGRNGTHLMTAVHIWKGSDGMLFIDGIGRSGKTLNAGLVIDADAAKVLLAEITEEWLDGG